MPYWDMMGRALIAEEPEEEADRIADFLTFSGLDATVAVSPNSDLYTVTVPSDQEYSAARLLLERMEQEQKKDPEKEAASYREACLKPAPRFVPSEEKFRTSTNSSIIFLCAGFVVFAMALVHYFLIAYRRQTGRISDCVMELILGFVFILFGISTQQKVRMLSHQIMAENAFTDQIIRWYTTTYSAEHLDKCIEAAAEHPDLSEEERFSLRRDLIRDYILREYNISDTAYLDFVTDIIYKRLYFPNGVSFR